MERLNKYLAHAGVGSRRHCDALIAAGRVKVNGRRVHDLGTKVDPAAHKVSVDDSPVKTERAVYWVVNKPPGYLCTNHDPSGRPLALDLIPHVDQRVYTVGRLDEASEGLLLMTNDGELANALTHPRYGVEKTYQVLVAGKPSVADMDKLLEGIWLSDGKVKARKVRRMKPQGDSTWIRVVLNEGKNREIRRMLAALGHKVMKLKRIAIGPVQLDRLPKGKSRKLSLPELDELRKTVSPTRKGTPAVRDDDEDEAKPPAPRPSTPRPPAARPAGAGPFPPRPSGPRPAGARPPAARPPAFRPPSARPPGARPAVGRSPSGRPTGPRRGPSAP